MGSLQKCTLGDLIEFQRGYDLPKGDFVFGEYPVQSSNGILGYHNEYKVKAPSITIGRSGTVGIPHLLTKNFFPHNTTLFVKDFKGNDVHYIFYLLKYLRLNDYKSGSGVPTMNRNHLHPLKIKAFRNIETQQKIASVLSTLDEKIALNNQINATLEQMAKTLYDYWFVQFDFPDDNGKPYKSSGGEMVYNDVLKRDIPKGWEVGVLGEIISLTRGLTYDKSEICKPNFKNSVGVLRATNVSGNVVDIDDLVYVSKNVSSNQIINQSNILIVMSSGSKEHIGKNGVYYFDENNAFGAFCSKVVPKIRFQNFVTTFLQSESFKSYVKTQCLGTNINNLNNSQITGCPIIKPDKTISHKFEDIVGKNFEVIKNNFLTNHELTRLRDWLLPMLMNGQVTVQ